MHMFEHDGHVAAMFFIACFSVKLVIHKIFVIVDSIIGSVWFALNRSIDIGKRNNGAFDCTVKCRRVIGNDFLKWFGTSLKQF